MVQIREANPESDIDQIVTLLIEFQEYLDIQDKIKHVTLDDLKIAYIKNAVTEVIKSENYKIFVAVDGSKLVGYIYLFFIENIRRAQKDAHVQDLFVSLDYHRNGVGTLLFNTAKEYCRINNMFRLKLTSGLNLVNAHKFYEKNDGSFTEKMFRFDLKNA